MTIFDQVREFHIAFDCENFNVPTLPNDKLKSARNSFLKEEYDEFVEAYSDLDIVEIADALIDMAYIICGTLISYGLVPPNNWEPNFHDNVKCVELKTLPEDDENTAAYKQKIIGMLFAKAAFIEVLYNSYTLYEKHNDMNGIQSSLLSLLDEIGIVCHILMIPFRKIFTVVHENNMSKLGPDGKPIRRADGKVQKPANYVKPNIREALEL